MSLCRSSLITSLCFWILLHLAAARLAFAHEGATYPIAVDLEIPTQPTSSRVSIIADPDLNTGSLQFLFKSEVDLSTLKITTKSDPENTTGQTLVSEAVYSPESQSFRAKIPFSSEGRWRVHFLIEQGNVKVSEFERPLDVVPEGPSRTEFAIYTLPFLAMMYLGLRALWHQKNRKRKSIATPA